MATNILPPHMEGTSEEQFSQLRSYLSRLADDLNYEFGRLSRELTGGDAIGNELLGETENNGLSARIARTEKAVTLEATNRQSADRLLSGRIDVQAGEISAKVSSTGGMASTFGWSLTDSGFQLQSNGHTVFNCTASGTMFSSTDGSDNVEIADGKIRLEKSGMETMLSHGTIEIGKGTQQAWLGFITVGSVTEPRLFLLNGAAQTIITASGGTIGGNTIITSANIGSQSVSYASGAGQINAGGTIASNHFAWKKYSELVSSDYVLVAHS